MADPKSTPEDTPVEPSAPKAVVLHKFRSVMGVHHHPTTLVAGTRLRFAPGVVTEHEMDTFCKNMVASGHFELA